MRVRCDKCGVLWNAAEGMCSCGGTRYSLDVPTPAEVNAQPFLTHKRRLLLGEAE